jgi:hemoglobin
VIDPVAEAADAGTGGQDDGQPGGEGRNVAADAASSPFEQLGGEPGVRALVDRFYDLMELEPTFAELRALHPGTLEGSRDKLFWFLCGWLGGPDHYVSRFGHPRLRARHLPYAIGIVERDQWVACMGLAMEDTGIAPALAERLAQAFFGTADWMRNR